MMTKRIALTGATGFAGGFILRALIAHNHHVNALVRDPQTHQFPPLVNIVKGDLENIPALEALVADTDVVVHVAGAISAFSKADYFKVNLVGTRHVFEAAMAAGAKRFIYISSLAARMPEISPYAASKNAAEDYLLNVKTNMEVVILRPSAIYGPGDKATLPLLAALQSRVALLPGKASARFSLVHVADFAAVVASTVNSNATGLFEIDDMAGGHAWAELAAINVQISGMPQHITYLPKALVSVVALGAEALSFFTGKPGLVNRAKVRELYHPDWVIQGPNWPREMSIRLTEGLQETLTWYRTEGWLPPLKRNVRTPQ
jgi:nucleoside-diphosphate-sugar epimerase